MLSRIRAILGTNLAVASSALVAVAMTAEAQERADAPERASAEMEAPERAETDAPERAKAREPANDGAALVSSGGATEDGRASGDRRLFWRPEWRRVGWTEVLSIGAVLGGTWLVSNTVESRSEPGWTGPILFDAWVRDHLLFETPSSRSTAAQLSDVFSLALVGMNLVVDDVLVVGFHDDNPDVAWELLMIDAQSYAINGFVANLVKSLARRQRPFRDACARDPNYSSACGTTATNRSFFSGHSSFSGTSAGLICAHHTHLPLYGGGIPDLAACLGGIGFAVGTGAMRISSDVHWASDVLAGQLSGFVVGFLLPTFAYYRNWRGFQEPPPLERETTFWTVVPDAKQDSFGLRAIGLF